MLTDHPGRRGWPPEFRAAVVAAVRAGSTHREAAENHGVSTASVYKWCVAAGVSHPRSRVIVCGHGERPIYALGRCRSCYGQHHRMAVAA